MGALRKIIPSRLRRGQTTILVAGIIVVFLLMFLVVGVDFARMYYVRGELQNAADAAALAGAKALNGSDHVDQIPARRAAWKFACRNKAAQANVYLVATGTDCNTPPDDLNNGNNANGDIVLGYWNGTTFSASVPSGQPVNAVKVVARRVGTAGADSPGGSVALLFGKLVGWPHMDVVRQAIASRLPRPTSGISLCIKACPDRNPSLVLPNNFLLNNQIKDSPYAVSYTEFDTSSSIGTNSCLKNTNKCDSLAATCDDPNEMVAAFIWQRKIAPAACIPITWANGESGSRFDLACAFASTTFDAGNKTFNDDGTAKTWNVLVPLTDTCPSGNTPGQGPYDITGWAEVTITNVVPNGTDQGITISAIHCISCDEYSALGNNATLVK